MQLWLSDQLRLLALVIVCALLWSLEFLIPLVGFEKDRLRRAVPNVALTLLLILTNLALSFASSQISAFTQTRRAGLLFLFNLSPFVSAIFGVIALDLFAYLAHLLLHKSWFGWQFHRVHHSEKEVDVTTAFRQHPCETVWRMLWQMLAIAVFGLPLWIVVIYLMIAGVNAQLEHANIRVNSRLDSLLRLFFVTPNMHKVHHSRKQKQTDTNYSNIFSFWDRLGGTYSSLIDLRELRYGLKGFDEKRKQTLRALLTIPFSKTV